VGQGPGGDEMMGMTREYARFDMFKLEIYKSMSADNLTTGWMISPHHQGLPRLSPPLTPGSHPPPSTVHDAKICRAQVPGTTSSGNYVIRVETLPLSGGQRQGWGVRIGLVRVETGSCV
jgi:hypothetical protein